MLSPSAITELRRRLEEIEREREYIRGILDVHSASGSSHVSSSNGSLERTQIEHSTARRGGPKVTPHSRSSRILEEARKIVAALPSRRASFLQIFDALPKDLTENVPFAREQVRQALKRSGARVQLQYVTSDVVKYQGDAM